jgi:hypothetical protein
MQKPVLDLCAGVAGDLEDGVVGVNQERILHAVCL